MGNARGRLRDRGDDVYETPPRVWEPCCGSGRIVEVLTRHGHRVTASDLRVAARAQRPDPSRSSHIPQATSRAMTGKFTVKIESFTRRRSNSLYGFADLMIVELHLRIREATIHQARGRRWIGLPARPQIDRDGAVRRDDRGKIAYVPVLQLTDRQTSDAFAARAIEALLERYPQAFDDAEAA
jgi:hypothetical protein